MLPQGQKKQSCPIILLFCSALVTASFALVARAQFPNVPLPGRNSTSTVTAHQLEAPPKARDAVERAQKAMLEGKTDLAYNELSRALAVYPRYAVALATRGLFYLNAGKFAEAAADFEIAIAADPDYGPAYIALGAIYNHNHKYDDAQRVLTRGVQLQPTAWQAHFQMGQALFGKGEDAAALRAMTEATRSLSDSVSPEDRAEVHFWRAHVLVQLKRFSEAKPEYEQVVKEQPNGQFAGFARQALALLPPRDKGTAVASGSIP